MIQDYLQVHGQGCQSRNSFLFNNKKNPELSELIQKFLWKLPLDSYCDLLNKNKSTVEDCLQFHGQGSVNLVIFFFFTTKKGGKPRNCRMTNVFLMIYWRNLEYIHLVMSGFRKVVSTIPSKYLVVHLFYSNVDFS